MRRRGEARQRVGMMNLLSSIPTQTTRKPFGTMFALLEVEEDVHHGSCYTSEIFCKFSIMHITTIYVIRILN